ncbi:SMP-30/gluconolactonase/LRE family protein [Alteromonas sp. KUL49]|uniref:SMP-30/gluconolactonase/LRE family protein n=1 Tax=Alteromonas sp. KUL49 TaxID=2480798 RepID=UPI001F5EBE38|nr:SMP-30/gluconolactonase/LRE family protein [Alteromonas sp. KUL49]
MLAASQIDSTDWVTDKVFTQGVEGPVVDEKGNLYAVNYQQQGTIGVVAPNGEHALFVTLPEGSIGNGLRFNSHGQLLVADYNSHKVLVIDMQTKAISVLAHNTNMNQPNDIAISSNDVVYASDPNWADNSGQLWMITPSGQSVLVESDMGTTNGIEVSPSGKVLYVNESVQRRVWRYDINAEGMPINKSLFYQFDDHGLDGMRTDNQGNLFIARYGAGEIAVLSPNGTLITTYHLKGQFPTNVAFGGAHKNVLYVTMQKRGAIERLMLSAQ